MDPNAEFLKLFLRHQGDLKAFLASVVRDRAQIEDLFQEVSLVLWQSFKDYDPARPFGAWARGIAANKVLQAREKTRRFPLAFSPAALQAVLEAYDRTEPERGDQMDRMRRCISKLPEKSRRLLALRYEESLKLGEIALRAGSTLDAVHKMLSRIREAVQACMAGQP
jgi:RNA polymerase sigma-70 factor (ECF subfamily)